MECEEGEIVGSPVGEQDPNSGLGSLGEKSDLRSSVQGDSLLSLEMVQLREEVACLKQALHSAKLAGPGMGGSGQGFIHPASKARGGRDRENVLHTPAVEDRRKLV